MVTPSASAVLRLITKLNRVGCSIGRSPGFAPLKILSTNDAARAQQPGKLPTIGFLGANTRLVDSQRLAAFVERLRELGWIENRTVAIEYRWGEGRDERFARIAAEFVRRSMDVIVTGGTASVIAVKQATSTIPIAFGVAGDPWGHRARREPCETGRQCHRPVRPVDRYRCQAPRTVARGCARSPPLGDLDQYWQSRNRAGEG